MPREPEDDALRWEGDDDPTLAPGWKVVGEPVPLEASDDGPDLAAGGADALEPGADASAAERRQTGSVELVVLGVLGGVYLLATVGWLLTAARTSVAGMGVLGDAMYVLGLWLAVLAPALWFGFGWAAVRRASVRLIWLAVGAVVLAPLPFVLGVTA